MSQNPEQQTTPKKPWSLKKKILVGFGIFLILGAIANGGKDKADKQEMPKENPNQVVKQAEPIQEELPQFEIVYEVSNKRYDGGKNYYVLMQPIDLANDSFENDVKSIIKKIVKDKGEKVTIDFFDSKEALELHYQQWIKSSLGRPRTKEEDEQQARHYIASYMGGNAIAASLHGLSFFPSAFTSHPIVGEHVHSLEFKFE